MDSLDLRTKILQNCDLVETVVKEDFYRYQRYNIPFSIVIFHSTIAGSLEHVEQTLRGSDKIIPLDSHFMYIIFDCVGHEEAYKATENMLYKLHNSSLKATFTAGVTSVTKTDEIKDMVFRAMSNLYIAMKEKGSSVEDDSVIDYIVLPSFASTSP